MLYLDAELSEALTKLPEKDRLALQQRLQQLRKSVADISAKLHITPPIISLSREPTFNLFGLIPSITNAARKHTLHFDHPPNSNQALVLTSGFMQGLEPLAGKHTVRSPLQFTHAEERAVIAHELGHTLPGNMYGFPVPHYGPGQPSLWEWIRGHTPDNASTRFKTILGNHLAEIGADQAVIRAGESPDALISGMLKVVRHAREHDYRKASTFPDEKLQQQHLKSREEKKKILYMDARPTPASITALRWPASPPLTPTAGPKNSAISKKVPRKSSAVHAECKTLPPVIKLSS